MAITCYIGGARAPELPLKTSGELVEMALRDLREILGVRGRPVFEHVAVYKKAIPQYNVGFAKYRALMSGMELKAPGLFVAGHARDGVSLGDSIISGHNTAGRIQSYLTSSLEPGQTAQHPVGA